MQTKVGLATLTLCTAVAVSGAYAAGYESEEAESRSIQDIQPEHTLVSQYLRNQGVNLTSREVAQFIEDEPDIVAIAESAIDEIRALEGNGSAKLTVIGQDLIQRGKCIAPCLTYDKYASLWTHTEDEVLETLVIITRTQEASEYLF